MSYPMLLPQIKLCIEAGSSSSYIYKTDGKASLFIVVCDLQMVAGNKLRNIL